MKSPSLCGLLVVAGLCLGAGSHASAGDSPGGDAAGGGPQVTAFQATSEAEMQDMRHRHLWLAYGALWAIAFAFIWRTARRQQGADRGLLDLESRLDAWERERG